MVVPRRIVFAVGVAAAGAIAYAILRTVQADVDEVVDLVLTPDPHLSTWQGYVHVPMLRPERR